MQQTQTINVTAANIDCEIINLQQKVKTLRTLNEAGTIKFPHIFFSTANGPFAELQQSDFHFNLPDKIHEMILESLLHYEKQLERLIFQQATQNCTQPIR
jgi:hypothetical protein